MYEQLVSCTVAALEKKVKDNNKIHLSSGERLEKSVVVERIHKNVFEGAYGTKYTPDEVANRHMSYHLRSLDKIAEMMSSVMVRVYSSGDICIVAPWAVLTSPLDDNREFGAGKLVLPVTKGPVATVCFLPCGGLDFDTDQVPTWADKISITRLVSKFDVKLHPAVWRQGRGKFTVGRKKKEASIVKDQIKIGEYIRSRGASHEIISVDKDVFLGNADRVVFKDRWESACNEQLFTIAEVPFLYGVIRAVRNGLMEDWECDKLELANLKDGIGALKLAFHNAPFNACGFLVTDTHIFMV